MPKCRLDELVVEKDFAEDINPAREFIMAGLVVVDDPRIVKKLSAKKNLIKAVINFLKPNN